MITSYVSFEIIGECLFVMGWTYLYSLSITAVVCAYAYEGEREKVIGMYSLEKFTLMATV